jgi:hypothetical protein
MHEQSWLDERKDFGDAEVVSRMRKTHGKKEAKNGGAEWRVLAGKKLKVVGFGRDAAKESSWVSRGPNSSSLGLLDSLCPALAEV